MKRFSVLIILLVVAAWVTGCRSPQGTAESVSDVPEDLMTRDESPDFNDAYGGYNMKDEAPGFDDDFILSEFAEETTEAFDDPFSNHRDVEEHDRASHDRVYLMITWGNLHRDSTITHTTAWDGSLTVDPGTILLKRTIHFERNDEILPRERRDLLEWVSQTGRALDGIVVRILPRPTIAAADTMIDSSAVVIEFQAGEVHAEFTLADLPGLRRILELPDGNAVAFNAIRIRPHACAHGFLRGHWVNHPERPGGVYYGRWATQDGSVKGYLRGRYGMNDEGRRVFFGKMVSMNGRFEGIMRGTWGPGPSVSAVDSRGWFAGHWVDRRLRIAGGLKGEWARSNRCHGGFFRGGWAMNCDGNIDIAGND
jgi:hypothetical protein